MGSIHYITFILALFHANAIIIVTLHCSCFIISHRLNAVLYWFRQGNCKGVLNKWPNFLAVVAVGPVLCLGPYHR